MSASVTLNHLGLCVTEIERSRHFYESVLGFTFQREMQLPDPIIARLLQLTEPVGLTAVYLTLGDFVLELLHFSGHDVAPRTRSFADPGLTHLSFTVDDLDAAKEQVVTAGGSVLADTDIGVAVLIRDPDGQVLELLAKRKR